MCSRSLCHATAAEPLCRVLCWGSWEHITDPDALAASPRPVLGSDNLEWTGLVAHEV